MTKRLSLIFPLLAGALLLLAPTAQADHNSGSILAADSPLENTERNVRDKEDTSLTPEDQKETKKDIKITAHIRKAVVKVKSLSVDAHNVKIITRNGVVTLRGPVESAAESMKIEKITKHTRGVVRIDNQLEIKAP